MQYPIIIMPQAFTEKTHKGKPLPIDLFIPADFSYLRCLSSFRPIVDERQDRAEPDAVIVK